jgi:hypothetical protein
VYPLSAEIEEYKEIGLNLRHYSNMQFVNLTLSLATQAALLTTLFRSPPLSVTCRVILEFAAILFTVLFYINEHRLRSYWRSFLTRAITLEKELNLAQYRNAPNRALISSGNAIRGLYVTLSLFWIAALCFPGVLQ